MKNVVIRLALGVALPLAVVASAVAADKAPGEPNDPSAMCAEMMKGAGPEGDTAMRDFMQSERAPQAMASMMSPPGSRPAK